MYRKVLYGGVAAMALVAGSHSANGQETLNFTIATGHPEVFLWVKHLKATFIPVLAEELAKTNEVKINWTEGYGGTIVKLGSEVEAFQQGIMEVGQMSGVFNPAQLGLLNLTYAMPFGPADPRAVTEAVDKVIPKHSASVDERAAKLGFAQHAPADTQAIAVSRRTWVSPRSAA